MNFKFTTMHSLHTFLLILGFTLVLCESDVPVGHMLPLGSHVKPDPVDEVTLDNMISPQDFFNNYVIPKKPIVFRGVVKEWPAFSKFTDDYLRQTYGSMELRMEGKKEKQTRVPIGDISMGRDSMKNFINTYHEAGSKKYIVSELPQPMYHEVSVVPPMTCGPFKDNFVEIDLWINGGNASSILHKDAFNTVNCVVNGTKDWKLVSLEHNDYVYQAWEGMQQAGYGGYSLINPDKVDMIKFPRVAQIPRWQHTVINKGDCLHLPSQMWHHVKSSGESNLAVAFLFSRYEEDQKIPISFDDCPKKVEAQSLDQFDVDWQYPGHGELTMGYMELVQHRLNLYNLLNKKGVLSKKKVLRSTLHNLEGKTMEYIKERGKELYKLLQSFNETFTKETIESLTKADLRLIGKATELQEASNTVDFEYSYISSEDIRHFVEEAFGKNPDGITWNDFLVLYRDTILGSEPFAKKLFAELAGEGAELLTRENYDANIDKAMEKYDWYVLIGEEDDDDEERFNKPQGFKVESREKTADFEMDDEREHLRNKRKTKGAAKQKEEL